MVEEVRRPAARTLGHSRSQEPRAPEGWLEEAQAEEAEAELRQASAAQLVVAGRQIFGRCDWLGRQVEHPIDLPVDARAVL